MNAKEGFPENCAQVARRIYYARKVELCEPRLLLFAGQLDVFVRQSRTASQSLDAPIFAGAVAAIVQRDGKVLVAGADDKSGAAIPLLARYLRDGQLDPSFGQGGRLTSRSTEPFIAAPQVCLVNYSAAAEDRAHSCRHGHWRQPISSCTQSRRHSRHDLRATGDGAGVL